MAVCKTLTADGRFFHPVVDGAVKRVVMCFTRHRVTEKENHLYIEQSRHLYTDDFKRLTKDFYLD